jgi:hypothetical protein
MRFEAGGRDSGAAALPMLVQEQKSGVSKVTAVGRQKVCSSVVLAAHPEF